MNISAVCLIIFAFQRVFSANVKLFFGVWKLQNTK